MDSSIACRYPRCDSGERRLPSTSAWTDRGRAGQVWISIAQFLFCGLSLSGRAASRTAVNENQVHYTRRPQSTSTVCRFYVHVAANVEFSRDLSPCNTVYTSAGDELTSLSEVLVTAADFRRIALSLPSAVESSHSGVADFRVGGRIFATLAFEKEGLGVLALPPDQKQGMIEDAPDLFSAGPYGATLICLAKVKPDVLEGALRTAWSAVSEKKERRSSGRRRVSSRKKRL